MERDHRRLAALLRPGMSVLDVGCGTGAITAGIARLVGPEGSATGVDRDEELLALARDEYARVSNLNFHCVDVLTLPFERQFDVVTSARTLQWISDPGKAWFA
ncbi:MAG: methyltransferase domain-containing protein [Bryobacteraceae bacterium]